MKREQAKQLLQSEAFKHFANGGGVLFNKTDCEAEDIHHEHFLNGVVAIKPAPKLRAWKPEEVPVGALIKVHHAMSGSVCTIGSVSGFGDALFISYRNCEPHIRMESPEALLADYTHSTDNGKTWKACGVEESA